MLPSISRLVSTAPIYISKSHNALFNLTFEDWLFRHGPQDSPLLMIYRDSPCVILGRNQNPWKEINMPALRRTDIPFWRRRSGGGTVFHDLGNTNFSIHLPRTKFDRHETAQVVLRAVRSLGTTRYVSGSAYKIVNKRAYHHGTMLISTKLETLGDLLRTNKDTMITKGVASVRSPVCNLEDHKTVTHDSFTSAVVSEFQKQYNITDEPIYIDETHENDYIRNGMKELQSWAWAFGQTPEFTYKLTRGDLTAEIHSKHGIILSCTFSNPTLDSLAKAMEGHRYDSGGDLDRPLADVYSQEVWAWLVESMHA